MPDRLERALEQLRGLERATRHELALSPRDVVELVEARLIVYVGVRRDGNVGRPRHVYALTPKGRAALRGK